jgi:flagellar hook-basal body protein
MAGDSFSITQTGLQGIETSMQAVSDNLANAQTNGFQAETVDFGALLGEYISGNALGGGVSVEGISRDFSEGAISQVNSPTDMAIQGTSFVPTGSSIGLGSKTASVDQIFTEGQLDNTGNPLDIAIQGNGFFQVSMPDGSIAYTRDGSFRTDQNGRVVTLDGYAVMPGINVPQNAQNLTIGPGGATVEREVADTFGKSQQLEIDLNDPDAAVALRAADAIRDRYEEVRVNVVDPGTLEVTLPISLSPVRFTAALDDIAILPGESDRVVMDERTGTIVVGGALTVGNAAISHGSLTVTIEPTLAASQPAPFSRGGSTVSLKTAKITSNQEKGEFFMIPKDASVEQITETLNAVGTKPGDTIAIFEGLRAAGALHGELIIR